jgi:hypothetical protein
MNSEQLFQALNFFNMRHKNSYSIGVYAADQLPKTYKKPAAFVANTDDRGKPGTHWVAFFIPRMGEKEFFDSYGLPPLADGHVTFFGKGKYNRKEMQSLTSSVCGHYCLMFLACRMNGYTLTNFQSLFTDDLIINDKQVETCFSNVLKHLELHSCQYTGGQYCCSKL